MEIEVVAAGTVRPGDSILVREARGKGTERWSIHCVEMEGDRVTLWSGTWPWRGVGFHYGRQQGVMVRRDLLSLKTRQMIAREVRKLKEVR